MLNMKIDLDKVEDEDVLDEGPAFDNFLEERDARETLIEALNPRDHSDDEDNEYTN